MKQLCLALYFTLISPYFVYAQINCRDLFDNNIKTHENISSFFKSATPVRLRLSSHFKKIENSSVSPKKPKSFPAQLTLEDGTKINSKAKAFGDSSSNGDESTFRKLNLTINSENNSGEQTEVFISTHVQTHPTEKWTPQGRITDGTSPYREALAYDIANVLNVRTPGYRRAMIEYENLDNGEIFTKPALLIENFKDSVTPDNETLATEKEYQELQSKNNYGAEIVSPAEGIRAQLFQILIGNSDYFLEIYNTKSFPTITNIQLKNVTLFKSKKDKILHPMVYDFDIAAMVAGHEISTYSKPWSVHPELSASPIVSSMLKSLLKLRISVKNHVLRTEILQILSKRDALEKIIIDSDVDQEGKNLALLQVKSFFEALSLLWNPEINFIQSSNVKFYSHSTKRGNLLKPIFIEDRPGVLRTGTPFRILGEENGFLKIQIIDITYDLVDYSKNIGFISKESVYSCELDDQNIPYWDYRSLHQ